MLTEYLDVSIKLAKDYLSNLDEDISDEIINESYTPAVTRKTRIVPIIDDAEIHSVQVIYTRRMVISK